MKITYNLSINKKGSFENLLKFWAYFRSLIVEKYNWSELPEKFDLSDCTYSEYEDVPYATVHIYSYNYDISFEKDDMKIDINLEDDEITEEYLIRFCKKSHDKIHDFSLDTDYKSFLCNTENPFYNELITTLQSIPEIENITPTNITFFKNKGTLDDKILWTWLRTKLSILYPNTLLPETLSFSYYAAEKEHYCVLNSSTFGLSIYLRRKENNTCNTFFLKHKDDHYSFFLRSSTDDVTFSLNYNNPDKTFWEKSFNELHITT